MIKCFLPLFTSVFLIASPSIAKAQKTILFSEDAIDLLTLRSSSVNYGLQDFPFSETYIKSHKIKSIKLQVREGDDTKVDHYFFDKKGIIDTSKTHYINDDIPIWKYNFQTITPTQKIYTEHCKTELGDIDYTYSTKFAGAKLIEYSKTCTTDGWHTHTTLQEIKNNHYIIIKDDLSVPKCLIYLQNSEDINDQQKIKALVKTIYESEHLENRRGVLFRAITIKDDLIFERLDFEYDKHVIIDQYSEISRYFYKDNLIQKKEVKKYLDRQLRETINYIYNEDKCITDILMQYRSRKESVKINYKDGLINQVTDARNDIIKYSYSFY